MTEKEKQAIENKDEKYDGRFYYTVQGEKTFCTASCTAKSHLNVVETFSSIEEAVKAGYLPCEKCRPDLYAKDAKARFAKNAQKYIDEHYSEKITVDAVAQYLFINKHYLMRLFKEKTGVTLMDYLNKVRCNQANKMMDTTRLSLEIIAYSVGFKTASHFSHNYKKVFGYSPSEYRNERNRTDKSGSN